MCHAAHRIVLIFPALVVSASLAAGPVPERIQQNVQQVDAATVSPSGPHEERTHDPYMPGQRQRPDGARSAAAVVQRGPYISIQVNVDANGQNIVGDAANEPSIAVNPTATANMVIGWRQFDTTASNFRQAGRAYTHSSGLTWTFPGVLEPGVFRSDPVLVTDAEGVFYYNSLTMDEDYSCTIFKSVNGGVTFDDGIYALGGDKAWMAIDRTGGTGHGHLYAFWDYAGCCGDDWFTRSKDGAQTFDSPVPIPGQPMWGVMDVGPDGEIYIAGRARTTNLQIRVAKSSTVADAAAPLAFDFARTVDLGGSHQYYLGIGPNPGGLMGQVWVAVDHSPGPRRGHVYTLCSVDPPDADPADIMFSRSTDGGLSWSPPVRVNDDPVDNGAWQWFGTMSVAPNGRIDVVWNDTRNTVADNFSELYYASSGDGGLTWSPNVPLSPVFDSHLGWPNQNKLGDYYDMISDDAGANLAYAATFNGEQDVYFLRIGPSDCNGNGTPDADDIDAGSSIDCDTNGIPDECEIAAGSPDCNENAVPDECEVDCNDNGIPDECDINGAGGATVFATGIGSAEEIVASTGDYPPGFLVTGLTEGAVYSVSSLGGTATIFVSGFNWPVAATMAPDEFGNEGERLFVADSGYGVFSVSPSGTVEFFADLGVSGRPYGLVYIPQSFGGLTGGRLLVTSMRDYVEFRFGSISVVDADGVVTALVESVGAGLWTPTLAPNDFGDYTNHVFVGESRGSHLYAFNLTTLTFDLFANVPLPEEQSPGLRQVAFSPIGWAESFDPALANERVLLVSVALGFWGQQPGGSVVSVWDQRGKHVATLSRGPNGLPFEPRGLLFVNNDLLVSDLASDHDWLFRVTIDDFGLPDCDQDGILDECEIAAGSLDCNENGVPDECEVDCNDNGIPDQCDLIDGAALDCDGNFVPDSCESDFDFDGDGVIDPCDPDIDNDGVGNDLDVCDFTVPGTPIGSSGQPFGDWDLDCDVELDDFAVFEVCLSLSGPDEAPPFSECLEILDADLDADVDLSDVRVLQLTFSPGK